MMLRLLMPWFGLGVFIESGNFFASNTDLVSCAESYVRLTISRLVISGTRFLRFLLKKDPGLAALSII